MSIIIFRSELSKKSLTFLKINRKKKYENAQLNLWDTASDSTTKLQVFPVSEYLLETHEFEQVTFQYQNGEHPATSDYCILAITPTRIHQDLMDTLK